MASSNRHWPSMFKSKPCNNQQWPPHHDISGHPPSLLSNSCSRSSSGCEERSPEPKPRWNPKPEQIRILEAIFNSGMVNPPRDEIRRIRAQLQEYGQVGDANVFYWFQNRKSRSKHKQRSLQAAAAAKTATINHHHGGSPVAATSSSSSTSSDKASPKNMTNSANTTNSTGSNNNNNNNNNSNSSNNNNVVVDQFGMNNSPTSVNQGSYFHQLVGPSPSHVAEFGGPQSMYFPLPQRSPYISQGLCFGGQDVMTGGGEGVTVAVPDGGFSTLLLGEMISGGGGGGSGEVKRDENVEKFKFQQELGFMVTNAPPSSVATCTIPSSSAIPLHTSCAISSGLGQFLGVGDVGGVEGKSTVTVFVDDMAVEVPAGPFNVKEAFGEDAMLVHPTGHPVVTNEWGVTLNPLQHGALYYLVRTTISASPLLDKLDTTPDLLAPEFPYQI